MSELQNRLDKLVLRLDRMGMRVEQAVLDALAAAENADADAGLAINRDDSVIDREEVEIEQECIRLLALYQPTAVDLRAICTIIKVNSDLERIADMASSIGRNVPHVVEQNIDLAALPGFHELRQDALDALGRTVRMVATRDAGVALRIIDSDPRIDEDYWEFVRNVLDAQSQKVGGAEAALTVINLAKSLERIGDLCTNIAEDTIFLQTGDIVRHADALGHRPKA